MKLKDFLGPALLAAVLFAIYLIYHEPQPESSISCLPSAVYEVTR